MMVFMVFGITNAQIMEGENGLYYADNNTLYNGQYEEFHDNGNLKLEMDITNGLVDGTVKLYNESGIVKEIRTYKEGQMNGKWVTFSADGQKTSEVHYLNGKKHGTWHIWGENGALRYEMQYNKGKRTGKWVQRDGQGNLISEKQF